MEINKRLALWVGSVGAALVLGFGSVLAVAELDRPESISVDYSMQDYRKVYNRSVDIRGMSISLDRYSMLFSDYDGHSPNGKGYFLVLEMEAENRSPRTVTYPYKELSIVIRNGDQFPYTNYGWVHNDNESQELTLKPGEKQHFTVVFEMPSGSLPDLILFRDDVTGDDKIIDMIDPKVADDQN